MTRYRTSTRKVKTPFASVFVHVEFDNKNVARSMRISSPQKLEASTVGDLLDAISVTASELIEAGA